MAHCDLNIVILIKKVVAFLIGRLWTSVHWLMTFISVFLTNENHVFIVNQLENMTVS